MCFGRKTTRPRTHSYMGQEDQCVGGERHLMLAGRRKAGQLKTMAQADIDYGGTYAIFNELI